jgi:hypothetical protein
MDKMRRNANEGIEKLWLCEAHRVPIYVTSSGLNMVVEFLFVILLEFELRTLAC